MPLLYPFKRVTRNWKLFVALLIGIILASTFFAAINIKANLAAKASLDEQVNYVTSDLEFSARLNATNLAWAMSNISSIPGVESVVAITRVYQSIKLSGDNFSSTYYVLVVAFPDSELINKEWLNIPAEGIGENQTYLILGSLLKERAKIGDNISTAISFPIPKYYNSTSVPINLTVAGYADLTDKGYIYLSGNNIIISQYASASSTDRYKYQQDMMIVGWNSTYAKLWSNISDSAIDATFLINVDHEALINPWNTAASIKNVQTVADEVQNNILAHFENYGYVNNFLESVLRNYENNFFVILIIFILVSLPLLFVAWYMGSTVSDVSYNLRRREIGLLSTKGMSSGQIQRIFLTEALVIGFMGGVIGVVCGLALNQVFIGEFNINTLFNPQLYSPETMVITVIFGMILAFFSAFWSARKASKLQTVQALREYMEQDSDMSYRKKLPWIAFILGSYKMVVFALGLDMPTILSQQISSAGALAKIFLMVFVYFDAALSFIGPLLFLWGATKLLIENSLRFQHLTANV
jgi:ABC-type lipoprotein release transport system permease subunit